MLARTPPSSKHSSKHSDAKSVARCRRKFLRYYKGGFQDEDYLDLERNYKSNAHAEWQKQLDQKTFASLIRKGEYAEIAQRAVRIESRTNLIFSFEKMALRDGVKSAAGAKRFATGLYDFLHGRGSPQSRFERWCDAVAALPRKQTRVLTWPNVTVFGFIAQPQTHFFFKPNVTKRAAEAYGYELDYQSRPNWQTYAGLLKFAETVRRDLRDMKPRDMIDIQSFLWVQGSDEYPD
jgi:hypothetical protein